MKVHGGGGKCGEGWLYGWTLRPPVKEFAQGEPGLAVQLGAEGSPGGTSIHTVLVALDACSSCARKQ